MKIKIRIFEILNMSNFNNFEAFLILAPILAERVVSIE